MQERNIKKWFSRMGSEKRYFPLPNFLLRRLLYSQYIRVNIPCLTFSSSNIPRYRQLRIFNVENERHWISTIGYVRHIRLVIPNPMIVKMSNSDYWRAQHFDRHSQSRHRSARPSTSPIHYEWIEKIIRGKGWLGLDQFFSHGSGLNHEFCEWFTWFGMVGIGH